MSDANAVDVDENMTPIKQHKRSRHPIEFLPRCCPRYRRPRCFLVDIVVFTFTVVFGDDEEVIKVIVVFLLVSYEMLVLLVVVVVVSFARCSCVNNEARGMRLVLRFFDDGRRYLYSIGHTLTERCYCCYVCYYCYDYCCYYYYYYSLSLILTEISILRSSSSLLERARLFLSLSFNLRENKLGNALYQKVSLLLHFDETKVVAFLSFDFE